MKKVITLTLLVFGLALTGCTTDNTDLQTQVTTLETNLTTATTSLTTIQGDLATSTVEISELEEQLALSNTVIAELQEALIKAADLANTKLLNAFGRDTWASRKIAYDAAWTPSDAEFCFGVFDEDWSTIAANDYTHNGGLKFVITIEEVQWSTEYLAKDSCGNYSELIYHNSPYGLFSMPADLFEAGNTYNVVLYKEAYVTVPQLGLLPLADMGDYSAYPVDLSGIIAELVE